MGACKAGLPVSRCKKSFSPANYAPTNYTDGISSFIGRGGPGVAMGRKDEFISCLTLKSSQNSRKRPTTCPTYYLHKGWSFMCLIWWPSGADMCWGMKDEHLLVPILGTLPPAVPGTNYLITGFQRAKGRNAHGQCLLPSSAMLPRKREIYIWKLRKCGVYFASMKERET